jgi:choline kinase
VKVLILAAGMGVRLMPLTRNTPKSLLDLGHGLTLLETQLEAIRECGVEEVVLVTGYRSEQIEAKIAHDDGFRFRIVYNPFYASSNNLVSAWLAQPHVGEDYLLVNGDDVFDPAVMRRLLEADDDLTMMVSRKAAFDDDDMKVVTQGERVLRVGKGLDEGEANGESIGMMRFRARGARAFADELERMVRTPEGLQTFYLHALQNLMDAGFPVSFRECAPEEWAEVDFHPDLRTLKEQVFPERILPLLGKRGS